MPPELAEVKRWLEKADHDRRMAEAGLSASPPITDAAGFHVQQAVEKLLKAFLVFHESPFEKIHDLEILAEQCAKIDGEFATLIEKVAPLTRFAVRFRYPGPTDPNVSEVRDGLAILQSVSVLVQKRLPDDLHVGPNQEL